MTSRSIVGGSRSSEVQELPDDWSLTTIDEIARVCGGKRLSFGNILQVEPTKHPYVRVTDMHGNSVSLENILYVPDKAHASIRNYRIFREDLFISVAGTLGIVGRIPPPLDGANLTENADRLTAIKCDVDYLMYWLNSEGIQSLISSIRTVGAQPKLALGRIKQFLVPLPPTREEQERIAEALRDADVLIDSLRWLIAKKQAIKQGMMQELLTGRTRVPGFTQPWKEVRLGDHVTYIKTVALSRAQLDARSPIRYLHYGDIHTCASVTLDAANAEMPRVCSVLAANAGRLQVGDLVFADASEDLAGVGKSVEVISVPEEGLVPGLHTIAARFEPSILANRFKAYLQFHPQLRGSLSRLVAGTKVLATTRTFISGITLLLPSVPEQQAIARVLLDTDDELVTLSNRLQKAKLVKQGMMQELLTGRTRLVPQGVPA